MEDNEGLVEEDDVQAHPDIPAQLPGIKLESEQSGSTQTMQDDIKSDAEVMHAAAVNAGIDHNHTTGEQRANLMDNSKDLKRQCRSVRLFR